MRVQVRIGDQYAEVKAHLEQLPQELRGKRLLLLAAMQLSIQEVGRSVGHKTSDAQLLDTSPVSEQAAPAAKKARSAPSWITQNVAT